MKSIPFDIGTVHFVGIGGIGMSGIAEVMHNLGYSVQGSDMAENANVKRLSGLGIPVMIGQRAENLAAVKVVVISSAIKPGNPELDAARDQGIPVVRRAEMLAELMRLKWCVSVAGTHGKTTTTSMVAAMLEAVSMDPTVINGGIINAYGTNARLGAGDWMVVEADESDGTFVKLPSTIAIVTNLDPEHLDFYGDFETEKAAFHAFLNRLPFYGAAVLCVDHPEVQSLIAHVQDRKVITYGLSPQADVRAVNISWSDGAAVFDVQVAARIAGDEPILIEGIRLPMPGEHNLQNATAAIAVGLEMKVSPEDLVGAFRNFGGVKRRFTKTGEAGGVSVIDDYGHHPVEIGAVLKAARTACVGQIVAVVQPHRYSRLASLFEDFCTCMGDADHVIIAPVFEAGETPIEGIDAAALVSGLKARGQKSVQTISGPAELAAAVHPLVTDGDMVICLGAGSITSWAASLPAELQALQDAQK